MYIKTCFIIICILHIALSGCTQSAKQINVNGNLILIESGPSFSIDESFEHIGTISFYVNRIDKKDIPVDHVTKMKDVNFIFVHKGKDAFVDSFAIISVRDRDSTHDWYRSGPWQRIDGVEYSEKWFKIDSKSLNDNYTRYIYDFTATKCLMPNKLDFESICYTRALKGERVVWVQLGLSPDIMPRKFDPASLRFREYMRSEFARVVKVMN